MHHMMTPPKIRVATITLKGFLIVVDKHVGFQLIRIGEVVFARFTFVRSFAGVYAQMSPKIGHLYKVAITVITVIGFFAGMQSHVCFQMVIACEFLFAFGTLKWFFAGMGSFVILQHVFVAK